MAVSHRQDDVPIPWTAGPPPWGRGDLLALAVWTAALAAFFWDALSLSGALFYFDITEINFPYRDFFARELRAGRFSRWFPGLYCGMPLYSESQAGYLHPLKYLLYPWLESWQAFNLDTIGSVWLTGLGAYGWLRRHVGAIGALSGASVFGLSGFLWAHLIHTSMTNALISVPFAFWALEWAWSGRPGRGIALGSVAIACQVFAGHLQDTLLTGLALGIYGIYRASRERGWSRRLRAVGAAAAIVGLGLTLAAVQWVPSKELLDRSPRAGGLTWDDLTFGSWSPELLPTLLVREAYGTRARDTDWLDGFYPYHEMNAYLGVIGLALAIVGASAYRDRWVGFWVAFGGLGALMMLGRFTILFDAMHLVPILGSSRIPVRYHLWVSIAAGALAAVGADRLARPGPVRLRAAVLTIGALAIVSIPILAWIYTPVWTEAGRWTTPYHLARYRWLSIELALATGRTVLLGLAAWSLAAAASRTDKPARRRRSAALLPILILADMLGAHWRDAPTVGPSYWTKPPASAARILADPDRIRVLGLAKRSAGEPGYASEPVDFFGVRDTLSWSLPPVWNLSGAAGETPIISNRIVAFDQATTYEGGRLHLQGVTHIILGDPGGPSPVPAEQVGAAYLHRNLSALPRARLLGRPIYATGPVDAAQTVGRLGLASPSHAIVEDPDRPLDPDAPVDPDGNARIVIDLPESVEVDVESRTPAYLILADTFDPGWTATLDDRTVPIRPAYARFRAVFVPAGRHRVAFSYEPAGFRLGLAASSAGLLAAILLLIFPGRAGHLGPEHGNSGWPRRWPAFAFVAALILIAASAVSFNPEGVPRLHSRWEVGFHRFTWGAGLEAMKDNRR